MHKSGLLPPLPRQEEGRLPYFGKRRAPTPPPRDPSGIHTIVGALQQQQTINRASSVADDSSSSSDETGRGMDRPSGYFPEKPPYQRALHQDFDSARPMRVVSPITTAPDVCLSGRVRSTPSPSPLHKGAHHCRSRSAAPSPSCQEIDCGAEDSTDSGDAVRMRHSSCRSARSHRGSMPPSDCSWGHHGGCCSPVRYHWCGSHGHCPSQVGGGPMPFNDDLQSRLYHLETEKEQLALQVNVLSEQVEAQNEKILELESALLHSKEQLTNSETQLRQEISSRSSAEGSKLDLMAQTSVLRLRLATVENDKQEILDRSNQLENELILTCACLAEKEADLATYKSRMAREGTASPLPDTDSEYDMLKNALSTVVAANDEKEKKIQEMKTSLNRYKKLHELVLSNPARRGSDGSNTVIGLKKFTFPDGGSFSYSSDMEDIPESPLDGRLTDKPPPVPRQCPMGLTAWSPDEQRRPPRAASSENVAASKTPPAKRHYSTLPRPQAANLVLQFQRQCSDSPSVSSMTTGQTSRSFHNLHHQGVEGGRRPKVTPSGSTFGRGFFRLRPGKRSSSAPELVSQEVEPSKESLNRTESPLTVIKEKRKGLKRIFGRVRRSGSDSLGNCEAELKRGGIRATAGPRLGWTARPSTFKSESPFREWNGSMVSDWLLSLGLSMYAVQCKRWARSGDHLLRASLHDFEKELGMKNPLHRKKLLLAVSGAKEDFAGEPEGRLDHHWVLRWLDDVGLPQYKDAFFEARVDGRVLNHLTVEDLCHLKVTNLLHHISIKCGIQVLRDNDFDQLTLIRRSLPEDEQQRASDVSRWSNHRLMEWLRTVDLSEYAPNLRGSGVHGGLVVHEPRFGADLLASLLNIPSSKTLLRRHLSTQFKQLIGADIVQKKREWEAQPGYCPLSPSAKVKAVKRSHFSLMRKRGKNDLLFEDYVCPLTFSEKMLGRANSSKSSPHLRTEEERFLMKENTLKKEMSLDTMPASNV